MPSINRTTVLKGPALVTYGGQSFWSKGDITVTPVFERFPIPTSRFGVVTERHSNRKFTIAFEPSGRFTAALHAVMWAVAAKNPGDSLLGGSDAALVVHGRDGVKITFHNAAITSAPGMRLSANTTITGSMTFTAILKNSTDPTNAAAYYTIASEAYPGDSGFAVADIITTPYLANWGSSPWADFVTDNGWEIGFDMSIREEKADGIGTYDLVLEELKVTAKAAPVGPTMAQIMTALKTTEALGTDLSGTDDLVIASTVTGGPSVTISRAAMVESGFQFGSQPKRVAPTTWTATRLITAGVAQPLFAVDVVA